jgi:hypothetical protein
MKKLLFALSLLPALASARSFELGLSAGYNMAKSNHGMKYRYGGMCVSAKGILI